MTATLLDILRKAFNKLDKAPARLQTDSGAIERLLRAKTGKAFDPRGARRFIQSGDIQSDFKTGLSSLRDKTKLQSEQFQAETLDQEQAADIQQKGLETQSKEIESTFKNQSDALLQDLERSGKKLDAAENREKVEQLAFNYRLQQEDYLNQLQTLGARERLDNDLEFKEALMLRVWEGETTLLQNDQDFRRMLNADQREFQRKLGKMDINYAMDIARSMASTQNYQTIGAGVGTIIGAGAKLYGDKYGE